MDSVISTFKERIRQAAADGKKLRIQGGNTKHFYGEHPASLNVLDTSEYAGVVSYEPSELVVTVRCGTLLAELEQLLSTRGQCLAYEPPHFGASATVGGMVAAGLAGPARASVGGVRDHVLGAKLINGLGEELTFGGQVMKNVAGFDVSRLMVGSLGTLGLILEVSLKVLPLPVAQATLRFQLPQDKALETMNRWAGKPLPVTATSWEDQVLTVRLAGAEAAVRSACGTLGGERLPDSEAAAHWTGLKDQKLPFFDGEFPLWRFSLPSTAAPLNLPGGVLVEWGGAQRWLRGAQDLGTLRDLARQAGGHATLFRGVDRAAGVFTPLPMPLAAIQQRLKHAFDPHGVFNRGRMFPDL